MHIILSVYKIIGIIKCEMNDISDVTRIQTCCCFICSYCCSCCINDFANITFYGRDGEIDGSDKIIVNNVPNSKQLSNKITRHLQELHKDFRQCGTSFVPEWVRRRRDNYYQQKKRLPDDFLTSAVFGE